MHLRRSTALLAAVACAFFAAGELAAQTGTVTGTVTEAGTNRVIPGAQLVIQGTNIGGLSNSDGRFLLTAVPVGTQEVRVVNIGYAQQVLEVNVTAGSAAVVDFVLQASAIQLSGLVVNSVTGRTQRARELGTNVGTIDLRNVEPTKVTSVADILSGRTEGVILQDVNGTAGSSQRIRIRGANSLSLSNEPLIYIDGILTDASSALSVGIGGQEASRLNDLNPNDIASMEVVKGPAAAALYGTAAANGVILITTKRGRAGAPEWNVYAEYGQVEDKNTYPANYLSYEVVGDGNASFFNTDGSFNSTDFARCANRDAAAGTCSQDGTAIFNTLMDPRTTPFSTGERQRYGLSVRGGSERVTYYLSGEVEDETGVISYNTRDRVNVRANMNAIVSDKFDIAVSTGFSRVKADFNSNDNSIFSPILAGLLGEGYFIPESVKTETGEGPGVARANYGFGLNEADNTNFVSNDDVDRITLGSQASYRPLNWLSINANGGLDLVSGHTYRTLQPGLLPISATFASGSRESDRATNYQYTLNTSAIASFQLADEVLSTTTVGGSYNRELLERTECFGNSLVQGTSSCGTTAALFSVDEDFEEVRTVGGYVQTEVAWRDRVFVAGALRGDDNSAFGTDFGFVTYPSASVSWVLGEEEFFPESNIVTEFRVRAAYGESGLRPDFRDAITLFDPVTVTTDGGDEPGITVRSTGNDGLKPERSREVELGFDAGLFGGRLGLDFTYFNKRSKDALVERRLAPSLGLAATRFENLGEIKNAGTELAVRFTAVDLESFGFNLFSTVTTLSNEVVNIGEGVEDIVFNRGLQRHQEGSPAGSFFQPEITWNDADGNGLLTDDEVTIGTEDVFIGPALPTWQTSVGGDVRIWDWLNISTLFEARGGNFQGNDSEAFRCGFRSTRGCSAVANPNATLDEQARYIADRFLGSAGGFVESADFLKWRELSVTLKAPAGLAESTPQLQGLSLTIAGRNLATWTDYSGLDPETVEGGGSVNFNQSEFNTQPPVRQIMLRLNYNF